MSRFGGKRRNSSQTRKGATAIVTAAQAAKLERLQTPTEAGSAGGAWSRKEVVTTTATLPRQLPLRQAGRMAVMRGELQWRVKQERVAVGRSAGVG